MRIVIKYSYEFCNEQSDGMKGQTQTTEAIRNIFEQYRFHGFNPLWDIEKDKKRENNMAFCGIEIDSPVKHGL